MELLAFGLIVAIGATGVVNSMGPIMRETKEKSRNSPIVQGYEELSNQVVDPRNIISDPSTTRIIKTERGPYGIPRNIHDIIGDYRVISHGRSPGLQNNI